jgi:hypothetical protein
MDVLPVELLLAVFGRFGVDATIQEWMVARATSRRLNAEVPRAFAQWLHQQELGSRFGESKCTVEAVNFLASHSDGEHAWDLLKKRHC